MNQNTHECENAVIGALLSDSKRLIDIDLSPDHFENVQLGAVFETILAMDSRGDVADLFTVADEMGKVSNKDWVTYLATIQKSTAGASQIKSYSSHVKRYSIERNAKQIATDMVNAVDSQGMAAVDDAIQKLMSLGRVSKKTVYTLKESVQQAVGYIDEKFNNQGVLSGVTSGFVDLDEVTGGFHDSDLIIVGARPAVGKTAVLVNMMLANDLSNGFISAEMSALQGALRMLAMSGRVDASKLRRANLDDHDWAALTAGVNNLNKKKVFIDEQSSPTIGEVQRQARIWKHENDINVLWVDYVQRIRANNTNCPKHERVEEVVMGLKTLAKELNIPVIGLCQVNRDVDKRPNKRPTMGDLSDSSAIEKEADIVAMLYRDEVYNPDTEFPGLAELNIEKNRHGPTGGVKLNWQGKHMIFSDLTNGYEGVTR
jgi:replicative DNA helicase